MKKFVKHVLLLTCILLVLASVLNVAIGKRNREPAHYRLQYEELVHSKSGSKYVILGSSHATHGIRPSYLNLPKDSVYNFALNGSNPEFYFKWYKEIFKKTYQKPEYIIYCIDWFIFDEKWLWRRYEHDAEYFPFSVFLNNLINMKGFDTKMLLFNRFPFIKYKEISDLVHVITNKPNEMHPVNEYDRGFIPYKVKKGIMLVPLNFTARIELKQEMYFEKLIDLLVHDGMKIIFVSTPELGPITNYTKLKSFAIVNEIAKKYAIPMLNYNTDKRSQMNLQRKYYSDWAHLNSEGSIEFSKLLSRDLAGILRQEKVQ